MMDEVARLKERIHKTYIARCKCMNNLMRYRGKEHESCLQRFNYLNEKFWLLQEKLDYLESDLIIWDDEIEIKRFGNELVNMYSIYLKRNGLKIGQIDYRGYHNSIISGDIGYIIDYRYRGNHFAYKALILLSDYLYDNRITDFYISVINDNIPSLKTILRYGGVIIKKDNQTTTYKCDTRKVKRISIK